jgi:RNA polymerase sigma-70 factor (ECF subfamily)
MVQDDDQAVVRRIRSGEVDAYREIMRRHGTRVAALVARRVPAGDVADVVQDVFVTAYRGLDRFSARQPFEHWLTRIALRRCCDYWRRARKRTADGAVVAMENMDEVMTEAISCAADPPAEQVRERVTAALARLPAEDRTLMEMHYFEDRPLSEVAAVLGWSLTRTKVRAFRTRLVLRRWLKRGEEDV